MTYLEHYGLVEAPFALTPKVAHHFVVPERGNPADVLEEAIERGEGLLKIAGEPGTGKTLLCRVLGQRLQARRAVGYVPAPVGQDATALLALVCQAFGLPPSHTAAEMTTTLRIFLEDRLARGHGAVLIVDEAQTLGLAGLEAVRLLSTFETESEKLVRIVLVGQPELDVLLASADLRQLSQRITVGVRTDPFSIHQSINYIDYRIGCCRREGVDYDPFTPRAKDLLARSAAGVPRLLNTLCDKALVRAATDGALQVTEQHAALTVEEVLDIARPSVDTARGLGARVPTWAMAAAAVTAVVIVGGVAVALYPLWGGDDPTVATAPSDEGAAMPGTGLAPVPPVSPGSGGFVPPPAPTLVMPRGETFGAVPDGSAPEGAPPGTETTPRPDEGPAALAALTARLRAGTLDSPDSMDDGADAPSASDAATEVAVPAMPTAAPSSAAGQESAAGAPVASPSLPADEAQRRVADALARLAALHEQEREAETRAARRAASEAAAAGAHADQIVAQALAEPPAPPGMDLGRPPWPVPEGQALPERPGTAPDAGRDLREPSAGPRDGEEGAPVPASTARRPDGPAAVVDRGAALAPLPPLPPSRTRAASALTQETLVADGASVLEADEAEMDPATDTVATGTPAALAARTQGEAPEPAVSAEAGPASVDTTPREDLGDVIETLVVPDPAPDPAPDPTVDPVTVPDGEPPPGADPDGGAMVARDDRPASETSAEEARVELPAPDIPVIEPFGGTAMAPGVEPPADAPALVASESDPPGSAESFSGPPPLEPAIEDGVGVMAVPGSSPGDESAGVTVVRGESTVREAIPEESGIEADTVLETTADPRAETDTLAEPDTGDGGDAPLAAFADGEAAGPVTPEGVDVTASATTLDQDAAPDAVSVMAPDLASAMTSRVGSAGPPRPTARPQTPVRRTAPEAGAAPSALAARSDNNPSADPSDTVSETAARSSGAQSRSNRAPVRSVATPAQGESYTAAELNAMSLESARTGQPLRLGAPGVPPRPAVNDDGGPSAGRAPVDPGERTSPEAVKASGEAPDDPDGAVAADDPVAEPSTGAVGADARTAVGSATEQNGAPRPEPAAGDQDMDWSALGRARPGELPPPDIPAVPHQ